MGLTKLHNNQSFELESGSLEERSAPNLDGLIASFPMDGTTTGLSYNSNVVETKDVWEDGQINGVGIFGSNGDGNKRMMKTSPWGTEEVVWATEENDAASDADGGWNVTGMPIDSTKTYRLTVWVRRENAGNGRTYFGCQGNTVYNLGTTTLNSNPYFVTRTVSESAVLENEWTLWVGYIHYDGYAGGSDSTNGIYTKDGTRLVGATDYKWAANQTTGGHRTYLYYSTSTTERHYWYDPRMEIYDSTSPTIAELLNGCGYLFHPTVDTNTTIDYDGVTISEPTTNLSNLTWTNIFANSGTYTYSLTDIRGSVPHPELIVPSITVLTTGNIHMGVGNYTAGTQASTIYSVSVWYYMDVISAITSPYMRHNNANVGALKWEVNLSTDWTTWPQRKWIRLIGEFTSNPTAGQAIFISSYSNTAGNFTSFNAPQIEEKNRDTGFVSGTRSSTSTLSIPLKQELQTYTIIGKFTPYSSLLSSDTTYTLTTGQSNLFRIEDTNVAGNIYYKYYNNGTSLPFLDADGSFGTSHTHTLLEINEYSKATYVITKTNTTFILKIYDNGVLKATHTDTLDTNNYMSIFHLGSWGTIWNSKHRDIWIYNRVLSQTEIDGALGIQYNLKPNGDVFTNVNENTNPNLWPKQNFESTTYGVGGGSLVTEQTDEWGTYHQMILSSNTFTYKGYDIVTESGESYVFSGWFWQSTGNTFNVSPVVIEGETSEQGITENTSWAAAPKEEWFYASRRCVADANVRFLMYPSAATSASGTVKWRNMCVQKISAVDVSLVGEEFKINDYQEYQK